MDEFVHWMENFKLSLITLFPPYSSSSHTIMIHLPILFYATLKTITEQCMQAALDF